MGGGSYSCRITRPRNGTSSIFSWRTGLRLRTNPDRRSACCAAAPDQSGPAKRLARLAGAIGSSPAVLVFPPMRSCLALLASLCLLPAAHAAKNLEIYFIDVEGGQATLIVAPSGESMLVDAGWAGFGARDAQRIISAAKSAHVKKIDYVLITHFHADHAGGAANLAERIPIGTFVDHGSKIGRAH